MLSNKYNPNSNLKKTSISCIYRSQNTNVIEFNQILENLIDDIKSNNIYLCGD